MNSKWVTRSCVRCKHYIRDRQSALLFGKIVDRCECCGMNKISNPKLTGLTCKDFEKK